MRVKLKSRLRREINMYAEMKKWGHHEDDDVVEAIEPRPNGGYAVGEVDHAGYEFDEPINTGVHNSVRGYAIGNYSLSSGFVAKDLQRIEQWDSRDLPDSGS